MARTVAMWNEALKEWNASHGKRWAIPKRGTEEYEQVMAILNKKAGLPKEAQPKDEVPPTEHHPGKFVKPSPFKSWLVQHFKNNR